MKIFNHSDHDGYCSAYLIKRFYNDFSIKNYDMDYSKQPDFSEIEKEETVFIVDFSFSVEKMNELDDFDNWKLNLEPDTKRFILGTKTLDISNIENWKEIEKDTFKFIKYGEVIEQFRDGFASTYRKTYGFETSFEGLNCFAMNLGTCGSDYFGEDFKKHDAVLPFAFNGEKWTVSIYTDKDIDVSEIAKKYNGGGHKKAAGFVCDILPFTAINKQIGSPQT